MSRKIFVNLPVNDLNRSKDFFMKLGFTFNKQFTDDRAACMVISDDIYAMLLRRPFFKTFTKKEIADSAKTTEVLVSLTAESRRGVDDLLDRAKDAGGTESRDPEDKGFMYGRAFEDLDGHIWEVIWMDPSNIQKT